MGLDQYAYVSHRAGERDEYWETAVKNEAGEWVSDTAERPREIMYWRKHPNLQGWMERLWRQRLKDGPEPADPGSDTFNGVELELTWQDIDQLEQDVLQGRLPPTTGFFYGNDSDEYYLDQDLEFCKLARAELFMKLRVFYNSSW
jgi:hypothetical protein